MRSWRPRHAASGAMRDAGRPTGRGCPRRWSDGPHRGRSMTAGSRGRTVTGLPEFALSVQGHAVRREPQHLVSPVGGLLSCRAAADPSGVRGGCRVVVTSPCVGHQVVVLGPVAGEDDAELPGRRRAPGTSPRTAWKSCGRRPHRSAVRTSPRYGGRGTRRPGPTTWRRWCRRVTSRRSRRGRRGVARRAPLEVAEDGLAGPALWGSWRFTPARRRRVGAGVSRSPGGGLAVHAPARRRRGGAFAGSRPARRCRGGGVCRCRRRCRPTARPRAPPGADPRAGRPHPPPGDLGVRSPVGLHAPQAAWTALC